MAPNNALPVWGNEKTMNLNTLILTNIQSSPYFKVNLFELKTYHEVIDEIYYKVMHLEPWEKGSRKTAGQTGMCGGVRGVGAGGIVSSAYCLLYKLFTLKLTKKQLIGLITHADSPYIRGLGFMYIRYTQPPNDLWEWYEDYLDDEEEIDVKAGGGHAITIGELCRQFLVKLEWYSTLFPRIPVPVQKSIQEKLKTRPALRPAAEEPEFIPQDRNRGEEDVSFGEAERAANRRSPPRRHRSRSPRRSSPHRRASPRRSPRRSPQRRHSPRRGSPRQDRERDRERRGPMDDFARELEREKERQRREKEKDYKREKERRKEKESHRSRDIQSSHGRDRREETRNKEKRRSHSRERHERSRSRDKRRSRSRERQEKSHSEDRVERSERHKHRSTDEHREKRRSRSREPKRSRSKEKSRDKHGRSREDRDKDSNREHKRNRHDGENGES
ncbi:pre-mRNA-splicing factor 38B-like isoform X1 [Haliotis cracherodii]|uniref:pre-mRNA-splicing factor 38B-like isoform X1 n=2 Tax=Haliotis cracherodii TaxID=6455 RepID=UPI0039EA3AA9